MKNWNKPIIKFIIFSLLLSFALSSAVFILEFDINPSFNNPIDLLLWWISTITTVGAGPATPLTSIGKLLTAGAMLSGTVMYFAAFSELVIWAKQRSDRKLSGDQNYTDKGHVLIVGYNTMALALTQFLDSVLKPEIDIVLLTDKISQNPFVDRVSFIRSAPTTASSLLKANVTEAKLAFILSDESTSSAKADMNTMLVAGMIEDAQTGVYTIAEVSSVKRTASERSAFDIDKTITYHELLKGIRNSESASAIISKLPVSLRKELLKPEYQ